jgi:hypothetical protein
MHVAVATLGPARNPFFVGPTAVMSTVLLITGKSMNDALGAAGRAHRLLFENIGIDFVELNFGQPGTQELLNRTVQEKQVAFAYGPVGMGADIRGATADGSEVNFWAASRIPFISLTGDSPAYFFDRHVMPSPWHAGLYCYPEHLELRRRFKPTPAIYGTIPPFPMDLTHKREIDFRKKEGGKLLFLKNGNDPEKLLSMWRESMSAGTFVMLAELASELANSIATDVGCDIDKFVTDYFADKGWDLSEYLVLRLFFVAQLDDYLRRIKSALIANVLADFPVEIHGFNWEHVDFSGKRATYVPGGDYMQSRSAIIDSLGLVDMSPNTQLAPHDRALRAFGLYTLCVTNEQRFFKEQFKNSEQFCYRFDKDHLRTKVADVLARPKQYVELGVEVAEQFRQHRRPEDFPQFMLDTAGLIRVACGPRPEGAANFFVWPPSKLSG